LTFEESDIIDIRSGKLNLIGLIKSTTNAGRAHLQMLYHI